MKAIVVIAALLLSTHAMADEASKRAKILKLAEVQGLEQMFQQQVDQSKANLATLGRDLAAKAVIDSGQAMGGKNPRVEKLIERMVDHASHLFTAKEYADLWSRNFGKDLSEADIDQMLVYYKSPVGQKDVRASQLAMGSFASAIGAETQKRVKVLIDEFTKDLKAGAKK